jgi:hypothetical protein
MAEATLQPAFMGEWTWVNTTAPPPANAQIRLNTGGQTSVTAIFVSNITFYGIDASAWLMEMTTGYVIRLEDKSNSLKWQSYTITSNPIAQSGYVELKTSWLAGGQNLSSPSQTMLSVVSSVVRPTGNAATASVGTANAVIVYPIYVTAPAAQSAVGTVAVKTSVMVNVVGLCLRAHVGPVSVTGQLVTFDYAYPFQGIHYTSPGMTIRQYYVGQAITGFLASGGPISNLIGKGAELCFKVADSMIEYEAKMAGPPRIVSTPPVPAPPTGIAAPPGQARPTVPEEEVLAMQALEAAE